MSEVYLDKIKLGALIVEKELKLIEVFNELIYDLRIRSDIMDFINEYPPFLMCWRNLSELYDFLEYDYLGKIDKKKRDLIALIMNDYRKGLDVDIEQLKKAVEIIRLVMSKSKFHDVVRKGEYTSSGLDGISSRYKL